MKDTLRMTYTVCYDTKCMHNFNKKCKRAIPLGECRRRCKWDRNQKEAVVVTYGG